jgi:hypothetical protein
MRVDLRKRRFSSAYCPCRRWWGRPVSYPNNSPCHNRPCTLTSVVEAPCPQQGPPCPPSTPTPWQRPAGRYMVVLGTATFDVLVHAALGAQRSTKGKLVLCWVVAVPVRFAQAALYKADQKSVKESSSLGCKTNKTHLSFRRPLSGDVNLSKFGERCLTRMHININLQK